MQAHDLPEPGLNSTRHVDPFDGVLDLLDGVRRVTADEAIARCPAHGDKRASLAVRRAPTGWITLRCYAGCTQGMVLRALGRDMALLDGRG